MSTREPSLPIVMQGSSSNTMSVGLRPPDVVSPARRSASAAYRGQSIRPASQAASGRAGTLSGDWEPERGMWLVEFGRGIVPVAGAAPSL
jgi:hypothetical protein